MIIQSAIKSLNHTMTITITVTFTSVWKTESRRYFCRFGVEGMRNIFEPDVRHKTSKRALVKSIFE